jgi:HlyD family secretion protein
MSLHPSTPSRRRPTRRIVMRWVKRGALILLGLGIVGGLVYAWLPKPIAVDVALVRRTSLDVEVAEEGQTRVRDRFVVAAPITGNLMRIEIEPGTEIEAGADLARIEPPTPTLLDDRSRREAKARLAAAIARERRAEAAIAGAKATREIATREAGRARKLEQGGAIAAAERERAELAEQLAVRDLAAATTDRASAVAEAAAIRAVLGDTRKGDSRTSVAVTSPVAGQVLRVVRDSAGPVVAGTPLLELGDPRALEVVVDVLSSDAARIRPGMPVEIEAWGGESNLTGEVRRVEPSAFTRVSALGVEEQRVNVIVSVANPPPSLGDGFRVEARIFTWRGKDVLTIPASALFRDHGEWAVYAVENGRAGLRPIAIGHRGRLEVEVVSGLSVGTQILLHPSDSVRDGVRLAPR